MARSESFKECRAHLGDVVQDFEALVRKVETRMVSFKQVTKDCAARIRQYGTTHLVWYLKQWMKSCIGIKDECMVLLTGELVRPYHIQQHHRHIQDRGDECRIYKRSSQLSLCSKDGLDYEYRMIADKFGSKSVRFSCHPFIKLFSALPP